MASSDTPEGMNRESIGGPLVVPPAEDAGSVTQDRYDFQHHCTARRAITMLTGDAIQAIVCEWHEDYLVVYRNGATELVSVKHLEPSQNRWTTPQLCEEGGLKHLFERWLGTGKQSRCCLETDAGLRSGSGQPQELAHACHRFDQPALAAWAPKLARSLGAEEDVAPVIAFLLILSIDAGLPGREHIRDHQIQALMRPALIRIGYPEARAAAAYDAVVVEVGRANRGESGSFNALAVLADVDRLGTDAQLRQDMALRTLDRLRLMRVITALDDPIRPLLVPARVDEPTAMVKKLARGGLGPAGLSSAKRLRATWLRLRDDWSKDLPGEEPEIEDLVSQVLLIVQQAETAAMQEGSAYGRSMQQQLEQRLRLDQLPRRPALPLLDQHLMGLVYQLTDDCVVWWSEIFDVLAN